jgi:hypothetical protein
MHRFTKVLSAILLITPVLSFTPTSNSALVQTSQRVFGNTISKNFMSVRNLSLSHRTRDPKAVPMMASTIFDFSVASAEGKSTPLSNYNSKPVTLIVNVASA